MMFKFIMLLSLMVMSLTSLSANEPVEHEKLPLSESLPYLETIESQALRIGNGPVKVYVFVDPLCPHSRNFLSLISQSEKMKSRYAYYLFLYTLPHFKSYKEVASIYGAKKPLNTLIDFMVHSKPLTYIKNHHSQNKINSIAKVAKKIDVYKRPYLVMVKPQTKKREQ